MEKFTNTNPQEENKTEQKQYDFSNGCIIKANKDLPFFGLEKGDVLPISLDGDILRVGPLSWSTEQLTNEINDGIWSIEDKS